MILDLLKPTWNNLTTIPNKEALCITKSTVALSADAAKKKVCVKSGSAVEATPTVYLPMDHPEEVSGYETSLFL